MDRSLVRQIRIEGFMRIRIFDLVFSDSRTLVTASDDGTIRVWDFDTGRELYKFHKEYYYFNNLALSSDCRKLVAGTLNGALFFFDWEKKELLHLIEGYTYEDIKPPENVPGHRDWILDVMFSPDERFVLSCSENENHAEKYILQVWDFETGKTVAKFEDAGMYRVIVSRTGEHVFVHDLNNIVMWDVASRRIIQRFVNSSPSVIRSFSISLDGKLLVSSYNNDNVFVWDVLGGRLVIVIKSPTADIASVAFSLDNRYVFLRSYRDSVYVWDLEEERIVFSSEDDLPYSGVVLVSKDGRYFSIYLGGIKYVWEIGSWKEVAIDSLDEKYLSLDSWLRFDCSVSFCVRAVGEGIVLDFFEGVDLSKVFVGGCFGPDDWVSFDKHVFYRIKDLSPEQLELLKSVLCR